MSTVKLQAIPGNDWDTLHIYVKILMTTSSTSAQMPYSIPVDSVSAFGRSFSPEIRSFDMYSLMGHHTIKAEYHVLFLSL